MHMRIFSTLTLILSGLLLLIPQLGSAQVNITTDKSGVRTERLQFDDELVEGELRKPELLYLFQKKQFNYKRLIKLRENFIPEMRRDAEKIPLGRAEK